ncbi:MAG TPA: hypothetical protein P5121_16670 [Caldilineaceae bacterium]|nr:hypothetical protein [Caldilineaceae bacterium]
MSKVQVFSQVELDTEDLLEGVTQLDSEELERFTQQVLLIRANRYALSLPQAEAELLQKINEGVSAKVRERYDELHEKMLDEALAPDEQRELIDLSDQIEYADAQRLHHLIVLAKLRNISVDALMDELKLRRRVYA